MIDSAGPLANFSRNYGFVVAPRAAGPRRASENAVSSRGVPSSPRRASRNAIFPSTRIDFRRASRTPTPQVCFDDDNYYAPTYVETMVAHLEASGATMCVLSAAYGYDADKDEL